MYFHNAIIYLISYYLIQCAYINIVLLIRQIFALNYTYQHIPVDIGVCIN